MVFKQSNPETPCSSSTMAVPRGEIHSFVRGRRMHFPLYLCGVSAGFPSPTDDLIDKNLDLNELLIRHPRAEGSNLPLTLSLLS